MTRSRKSRTMRDFIFAFAMLASLAVALKINAVIPHIAIWVIELAIPIAYIAGRIHQNTVINKRYRPRRAYRLPKKDVISTTLLENPEPPDGNAYYGGQWNPASGWEPLDKVSPYPEPTKPPVIPKPRPYIARDNWGDR